MNKLLFICRTETNPSNPAPPPSPSLHPVRRRSTSAGSDDVSRDDGNGDDDRSSFPASGRPVARSALEPNPVFLPQKNASGGQKKVRDSGGLPGRRSQTAVPSPAAARYAPPVAEALMTGGGDGGADADDQRIARREVDANMSVDVVRRSNTSDLTAVLSFRWPITATEAPAATAAVGQLNGSKGIVRLMVLWARKTCNHRLGYPYCDEPNTHGSRTVWAVQNQVGETIFIYLKPANIYNQKIYNIKTP